MNALLPYLKYKIAARFLIIFPFLILGKGFFNLNMGVLLNSTYSILFTLLNLYIWVSFWKLIVSELGERKMSPFFIVLFLVIIIRSNPLFTPFYNSQLTINLGLAILAIIQIAFSLKLLTISHDLFKLKKWFAYTYLTIGLFFLLYIIISNSLKQYSELFSALAIYVFIVIFIANYIFHIQIFNRAEKASKLEKQNSLENLIDDIGKEDKNHDTTRA